MEITSKKFLMVFVRLFPDPVSPRVYVCPKSICFTFNFATELEPKYFGFAIFDAEHGRAVAAS